MIKKLTAVGDSLGLIIERPILDLLNITPETLLEVTTDGASLVIPAKLDNKERVRAATKRMMAAHDVMLRKLAQ